MSENAWTPGPWRVGVGVDNGLPCVDADDELGRTMEVCEVWGTSDDKIEDEACRANARLIAAAPEMADWIKKICERAEYDAVPIWDELFDEGRALLAKINGGNT